VRCVLVVCLGLTLLAVDRAAGQKQCRKGIPCGNTCISANNVCRTARPATPRTTVPTPARGGSAAVAPANGMAWVASSRGRTYYRRGCRRANRLALANLIFFRTKEEAEQAGYRRSTSSRC